MIFRWLICFSGVAAACACAATVAGQVELRNSKEKAVERGQDYSGVVIWLEPAGVRPVSPSAPSRATIVQKSKRFAPHVLAIRAGTAVDFPNQDPIFHNAFSNFSGQIFDIGLYKPGSSRTVNFNRTGVVRVFCNIHPLMTAIIVVVDTPWFVITGSDGAFRIPGVPPGEYRMRVFHERATSAELGAAERTLIVASGESPTLRIVVSESGFLPVPHQDKHNRPYRPGGEDYKVLP